MEILRRVTVGVMIRVRARAKVMIRVRVRARVRARAKVIAWLWRNCEARYCSKGTHVGGCGSLSVTCAPNISTWRVASMDWDTLAVSLWVHV